MGKAKPPDQLRKQGRKTTLPPTPPETALALGLALSTQERSQQDIADALGLEFAEVRRLLRTGEISSILVALRLRNLPLMVELHEQLVRAALDYLKTASGRLERNASMMMAIRVLTAGDPTRVESQSDSIPPGVNINFDARTATGVPFEVLRQKAMQEHMKAPDEE